MHIHKENKYLRPAKHNLQQYIWLQHYNTVIGVKQVIMMITLIRETEHQLWYDKYGTTSPFAVSLDKLGFG